jgi:tetrahydromethanopterin S-methyltransferase subunit D
MGLMALIGITIGGVMIGFGTHFVPVGGAPAAMGQAPGIATGVAMLAAGAGLAGLFGGAWAAEQGLVVATVTGGVGGGLMMAITCMMVNFVYVFGMGIPAASGTVAKGFLGGAGGTLIYLQLLNLYEATLPALMQVPAAQAMPIAVAAAGMFAVGLFLVNAVLTAYNITGTIEGPHDPKFKRWPRAIVASAVASAMCGLVAILIVVPM